MFKFFKKLFGRRKVASPPPKKGVGREPLLWYQQADQNYRKTIDRGEYPQGYPQGAVVHYTGGSPRRRLRDAIDWMLKKRYGYFVIDQHGEVSQNFPLNRWGCHAGKSFWPLIGKDVSRKLVGIEVCCPGKLESDLSPSFSDNPYDPSLTRQSPKVDNIQAGVYYKFTAKQEESLEKLILWLKSNNPDVFKFSFVLGHDEVSPKRKQDPGASLSCTMPAFRSKLRQKYYR